MTRAALLRVGAERLRLAGIDSARLDSRLLLAHALGLAPEALLAATGEEVPGDAAARFEALIARRCAQEPVALIRGTQEFWSLPLAVTPDTLIPRADTETLIEAALAAWPGRPSPRRVLDLGTGTGALLLAALTEFKDAFGVGIDRSVGAARVARANSRALGLASRAAVAVADWTAPLAGRFDLILSNPPYVRTDEMATLPPSVAHFEPAGALDGGADGLTAYRAIVPALPGLLAPAGLAVLEVGAGQAADVAALAAAAGLRARTRADLAGIARAIVLEN